MRRPAGGEWVTAPQAVRPGGLSAKGDFIWTLNRKKEMREVHSVRIQGWMLWGGMCTELEVRTIWKVMTELNKDEKEGLDSVQFYYKSCVVLRR